MPEPAIIVVIVILVLAIIRESYLKHKYKKRKDNLELLYSRTSKKLGEEIQTREHYKKLSDSTEKHLKDVEDDFRKELQKSRRVIFYEKSAKPVKLTDLIDSCSPIRNGIIHINLKDGNIINATYKKGRRKEHKRLPVMVVAQ